METTSRLLADGKEGDPGVRVRSLPPLSLNARLLLAAMLVLVAFLGLTGLALDKAFRASAEAAVRDRLQGQLFALLAVAEVDPEGALRLPDQLPEARFATPGSGLYAAVAAGREPVWRTPSMLGTEIDLPPLLEPGRHELRRVRAAEPLYMLSFGLAWELASGERHFTFHVAETLDTYQAQVIGFRRSLWIWLGGAALVLLAVQGSILRWSLAPLRRAAADLRAIESGERSSLEGRYPSELCGLTDGINALLRSERAQMERYRASLADLAHSLKTPLAVLRGAAEGHSEELGTQVREQVQRMDQIVAYQLQRGGTAGRRALMAPLAVEQAARRVVASLLKVYAGKGIECSIEVEAGAGFHGDEGDLLELLGNLADNAFKYGRSWVRIEASAHAGGLAIRVEDDGPGVPSSLADSVLERGVRASTAPGHGIGLAVVRDIAEAYGGRVDLGHSPRGGAAVVVILPG
jgi:two-component system, OmpR family, sensor histidine kinase PhoQ